MTTDLLDKQASSNPAIAFSTRLHHTAYVSADQERTRHFYEDVIGIPLTGFWIERETLGGVVHEFSLALYALSDGCALSFFNFANAELQERNAAKKQGLFVHLALKASRSEQDDGALRASHRSCHTRYFECNAASPLQRTAASCGHHSPDAADDGRQSQHDAGVGAYSRGTHRHVRSACR
jgi:catechol 2,3-dioxygenase-like lactoylglutathione lyase family enzyme